ncbi:hypothetical protein KSS87_000410, partial [Heliosperma pusillum]
PDSISGLNLDAHQNLHWSLQCRTVPRIVSLPPDVIVAGTEDYSVNYPSELAPFLPQATSHGINSRYFIQALVLNQLYYPSAIATIEEQIFRASVTNAASIIFTATQIDFHVQFVSPGGVNMPIIMLKVNLIHPPYP